ncbi:hypothetical protein GCM10023315_06410 [Algibacter aquimarinus]|uniref:Secretion system C-terminal sorting domain-containing protein n=2 Tax=Algibacter aquimarinus TaxID=1136748 RepID=A0ABP9H4A5_9FLAO
MKVNAQTVDTFTPNKYNTLYESTSNISNGSGSFLFAGRTAPMDNKLRRGLLQFDLSSIPTNATVTEAKLTLFMSRSIAGSTNVTLHKTLVDWGQGTSDAGGQEGAGTTSTMNDASWNCSFSMNGSTCITSWTSTGGDFNTSASATTSVSGIGSYEWSSTNMISDVQDWISNTSNNFGWFLLAQESNGTTAKRFDASGTNAPILEVTYSMPLSIDEFSLNNFYVKPNPVKSVFELNLPDSIKEVNVSIYNILGEEIYKSNYSLNSKIDSSNWTSGIYLIRVNTDGNVKTKRFLKL